VLDTVRRLLLALANFPNAIAAIAGHRQEDQGVGVFGIKTSEPRIVTFVTVIPFWMSAAFG
jgi:hypothetical protein